MNLINFITNKLDLGEFISQVKPETKNLLTGLTGSTISLFALDTLRQLNKKILIVENTNFHANKLYDDLNLLNSDAVHIFPVEESISTEIATSSPDELSQRLDTLSFLADDKPGIVVTSIAGLEYELSAKELFKSAQLRIEVNEEYDLEDLNQQFVQMGYVKDKLVAKPGDFAIRGDIVDIYPLNVDNPVRIDFFGNQVEKIKYFDTETQRSIEELKKIQILPAQDRIVTDEQVETGLAKLQKSYDRQLKSSDDKDVKENLRTNFGQTIEELSEGIRPENIGRIADYLFEQPKSLLDYLDSDDVIIFNEYNRLIEQSNDSQAENQSWLASQLEFGKALPEQKIRQSFVDLIKDNKLAQIYLSAFQQGMGHIRLNQLQNVPVRTMQQFFSQMPLLKSEVERWQRQKYTVLLTISNEKRIAAINNTLVDFGIKATLTTADKVIEDQTQIMNATLSSGFEMPEQKLAVITEKELFNKQPKKRRHQTLANAERLKSYNELKPGDYVVHVNHGIGKFIGMQTMEVDGKHQDYITIEYRDDGRLFIPVTQLDMVQKYVSAEGKSPKINKLGGNEWQKTKRRVQSNIEDIADDLIDLYAKREAEKGFAFPKDDSMQNDFDNAFPYPETPDQLRSVDEIKRDMEKPHPMDRLLVGDVGFGKTEVALRAAFKAVEAGKQVVFLVPTTLLAQQHYETMKERFAGFPVEIGMLSRFQTRKQSKEIIEKLEDGSVDIVVGTHRLLSKDVKFHDIGLLIIDEEQRFGVKHKEKIKQLKSNVDVLTLTATPIPRTLNMSMLGVRDLSLIETAPSNRYPVQTYVMEQNYQVIAGAIKREMARGGQVFYLHNRVEDMDQVADQLQSLVPDARIATAHGRMNETQMEGVISDYLAGDYDVLVTTTIIETGVDMPNTNTLVVENADRYGLSQLYQIRGRVGRSNRVAYAYLMYRPNKVLTEVGEQRLEAIKNFTELGSGFKIAMRDLSIRGAGNLLGKQQHGFIDSVGFDLYTQMLNDAVAKKRGHTKAEKTNSEINLALEAYLPEDYISDQRQKVELYKRIRQIDSLENYQEVKSELLDRFGDYPQEVANLLDVSLLKNSFDESLVNSVVMRNKKITIKFSPKAGDYLTGDLVFKFLANTTMKAKVNNKNGGFTITLDSASVKKDEWFDQLKVFAEKMADDFDNLKKEKIKN
ncbi:transcription-repair coupling factor [Companilactobacillus kimchii]|uniref:Transcription-repair-coupling factor n=1 Tax=Companilactobacillus kimchii TaxID=2801452 RepID=A0A210PBK7_9LACO|nr:transcription-repair coupling factor [Companilactobacillus kimchii]KAE9558715.1 transcription-repair coupling factor [Companilactobacillus kimchii]KAE9560944.1 transcription-repair coupling factor [Companilactobacillus kimchii]OWF33863.1 Transcription-repair-coupling factor [Companilactobacillus kimchii]GEO47799.1 transcription-repair-coupling factor [Companilactobacillus paralimentarius]